MRLIALALGVALLGVAPSGPLTGSIASAGVAPRGAAVSAALTDLAGSELDTMIELRTTYGWGMAFSWPDTNPCPLGDGINWGGVGCGEDAVSGATEVVSLILGCGARRLVGFPPILSRLPDLRELTIRGCWDTATPLAFETGPGVAFPQLQSLRFDVNALTGDLDEVLPTRPPLLTALNLAGTTVGGSLPGWILTAGSDLTATLRRMRLAGDLPDVDFGSAPRELRVRIDLSGNMLTGVLPDYILNSPNSAATLKVDYNMFDVVNTPVTNFDLIRPGWRATQTVPPTGVTVTPGAEGMATVSWTPIAYQANGGYYEVLSSTTAGGPYTSRGTTATSGAKTASSLEISGLPAGTNYLVVRTFTPGDGCLGFTCPGGTWNQNDLTSLNSAEVSALIVGPPTATISSPASGGTYVRDALVTTAFSCSDPTGPGIASCTDSGGEADGTGVLDTSAPGPGSYTVTAMSDSASQAQTAITYTVVDACPAGTFSTTGDDRDGPCTPAPVGYYVDSSGATSATACPDGTTTAGEGSASASACVRVPGIRYVAQDATGANNGSSWTDAFTSLTAALADAQSGDEIWVAAGTYTPGSNRSDSFTLRSGVAVYGGFAGDETDRADRDWAANETILSGDIGTPSDTADNSYHVVVGANDATLDGFTITGGNADGGGWESYGGGIFNSSSSPTLTNLTISGNSAGNGDRIDPTGDGGGIFNYYSSPTLTNVTISGNTAGLAGGGIGNYYSSPTLTNVTISGNTTGVAGGGINNGFSSPTIRNSIIWGNSGAQIYSINASAPTVTDSIVEGGYAGTGNLDADPQFVAPVAAASAPTTTGNYRIRYGSPARNAGNNDVTNPGLPATDLDGLPRIFPVSGGTVDLGAYEFQTACLPGSYSATGDDRAGPCTAAAAGHYVDTTGASDDTECAAGSYQPATGASSCTLASVGSYVDTAGATGETACPDGQTTETTGSDSADDCFNPDTDPPVIEVWVNEVDGRATSGWYNAASSGTNGVLVHVSATDATRVTSITCTDGATEVLDISTSSGSFTLTDGEHSISCTASDGTNTGAGPNSTAMPVAIKVDQTAPTLSASASANSSPYTAGTWSRFPVIVSFSCTDTTSGVASTTSDTTRSDDGADQSAPGTCTDHAGNESQTTFTDIDIDRTAPGLAPTVSPDPVRLNQPASATANASDALSGIASAGCDPVATGTAGPGTVACTATDGAGNQASAQASYTVVTPCAPGTYSATGDDRAGPCTPVAIGFYAAGTGSTTQTACPPGTTTAAAGATARSACRTASGSGLKGAVLRDLTIRLAATTRPRDVILLTTARDAISRSLTPAWWTGTETLARSHGSRVFDAERDAVIALRTLWSDTARQTPRALLADWIEDLVAVDRAIAWRAIGDARGTPRQRAMLAFAAAELLRDDNPAAAIAGYKQAWQLAVGG